MDVEHGIHRRSSLYYVEGVSQINVTHENQEERREHNDILTAHLQYIPLNIDEWIDKKRDFKWYINVPLTANQIEQVLEGSYVYYTKNGGFSSVQNDGRVSKIIDESATAFSEAEALIARDYNFPAINGVTILYSYHVNVGHGNLTLLVFEHDGQIKIWMIDGSDFDFLAHRKHSAQIDFCLRYIAYKFNLTEIHIDVLMITHAHYDHYSAITGFIKTGLIDRNTVVYLNLNKKVKSHNFNNLLALIVKNNIKIVPPFVQNSSPNIQILYPDLTTFSDKLKINDTSSVFNINFDGQSYFLFPGDLETEGWDLMDVKQCHPYLKTPRYYAISHHGSENGHLRHQKCRVCNTHSLAECLHPTTETVLMGRDKAFNGIYSQRVMNDFADRIYLSEKDNKGIKANFLEIDLISGNKVWY